MKKRIFALLGMLLVLTLLVVVQVSAKEKGRAVQKIGDVAMIEKNLDFIHGIAYQTTGTEQVNNEGLSDGGCSFGKNNYHSSVNAYLHFGKPKLLYHRRCSNGPSYPSVD